jgi:predicted nucleic acid-binding protein
MNKRLTLDANLVILLVVGNARRSFIKLHKKLTQYDDIDFDILRSILMKFSEVVLSPNVLTETSNLSLYVREPIKSEVASELSRIILRIQEHVVPSRIAIARPEYRRLGLTDAVLLEIASAGATLLTDDQALYAAAWKANLPALNFNHIRAQRPDLR